MSHTPLIAFDTETSLIANGAMAPPIVCLQWDDGKDRAILAKADGGIQEFALAMLEQCAAGRTLVGQNTAYDMTVLASAYPDLLPRIFAAYESGNVQCTIIRERLLSIANGRQDDNRKGFYSMDTIVQRRGLPIQVDKQNPWRMRYVELMDMPLAQWPEEAVQYAITDPTATRLIYEDQHQEAMAFPYEDDRGRFCFDQEAARQAGFDFTLRLMTCWGVRTDAGRIAKLVDTIDRSLAKIVPQLITLGIMRENGTKNTKVIKAMIEASFSRMGKALPTTPTGATKTDGDTIEACDDPALEGVTKHAYLTKLRSTYATKLMEGINGNIHARFHVLGANTGRTSSSGPNLQNQSKSGGIRECFVPRQGCVFVSADYDSQELRTLAQACLDLVGFSKLAERYQQDPAFDPHTAFAADRMGWSYEDAMRRKKSDPEVKHARQCSKAFNFGIPGGLGAASACDYAKKNYNVVLTLEESKDLKDAVLKQWSEWVPYFDNAQRVAEIGILRQLRSNRIRGGVTFCQAANSYFQGLASEASKTAVFLVSKACYAEPESPLYGCKPIMLVHDEIVIEAPEEKAHEAAMELQRLMVKAMRMWCPNVPASAEPAVSRCWSKDAKQIWENGRLVPWELPDEA